MKLYSDGTTFSEGTVSGYEYQCSLSSLQYLRSYLSSVYCIAPLLGKLGKYHIQFCHKIFVVGAIAFLFCFVFVLWTQRNMQDLPENMVDSDDDDKHCR